MKKEEASLPKHEKVEVQPKNEADVKMKIDVPPPAKGASVAASKGAQKRKSNPSAKKRGQKKKTTQQLNQINSSQ